MLAEKGREGEGEGEDEREDFVEDRAEVLRWKLPWRRPIGRSARARSVAREKREVCMDRILRAILVSICAFALLMACEVLVRARGSLC